MDCRCVSQPSSLSKCATTGFGLRMPCLDALRLTASVPFKGLLAGPTPDDLDIDLHRHPLGMVGVDAGVEDLVHPDDPDLLDEPRYLRGLHFGAPVAHTRRTDR